VDGETSVIVEFLGIPRLRAGCAQLAVPAGTVAEMLATVERSCPGLRGLVPTGGRLVPHFLLCVNGSQFVTDLAQELRPGDRLLLLSADVGG
jgi:hypothetical protein